MFSSKENVYIVDGCRTPFLKMKKSRGPFSNTDLSSQVLKYMKLKYDCLSNESKLEIIFGCTTALPNEQNISRISSLRAGFGDKVTAFTVHRNCGSGLQSIDSGINLIKNGVSNIVIAGGVDVLSRAPMIYNNEYTDWLYQLSSSKNIIKLLSTILRFKPKFFKPIFSLLVGLKDPVIGMMMGDTAEKISNIFNISRREMDQFSVDSHNNLEKAINNKQMIEILPIYDKNGNLYHNDTGLRKDCTLKDLENLKPVFDKFGSITAGNSSQITDGAAAVMLVNEKTLKKYNLSPKARITDIKWVGLEPHSMGLGPVYSINKIIQDNKLKLSDIDCWEINEAFAGQVLSCHKALQDDNFCIKELNRQKPLGEIPMCRLNINGGSIALGHPLAASGTRISLNIVNLLEKYNWNKGIASICIGGGQGGAILIERC